LTTAHITIFEYDDWNFQACEVHLHGVALVDYDSMPNLVKYLPEFELPEDVNERLDVLFRTRAKWTMEAIAPYIQ